MVVTSIEVLRSPRAGGMDIVRARGLATSNGWGEPHLLPIAHGEPLDGILDLIFQAHAPSGAAGLGPFMVVEAILPVEANHPYKGVRVRSSTNAVTLKTLPGYAEAAAPKEDCAKCVGKYFVAKGANPPAGGRRRQRRARGRPGMAAACHQSRPMASRATASIPTD